MMNLRPLKTIKKIFPLFSAVCFVCYFVIMTSPRMKLVHTSNRNRSSEEMGQSAHIDKDIVKITTGIRLPNVGVKEHNQSLERILIVPVNSSKDLDTFENVIRRDMATAITTNKLQSTALPLQKGPTVVNPHPFKKVLQPGNVCSLNHLDLLVYVHSEPSHFKHRLLIRQTWGNPRQYLPLNVRVIFVFGLSLSESTNVALRYESDIYGDIVQENFIDAYKNLTHKGVAGLTYVSENCQNARFVLKADDDVVVNVFGLMMLLEDASTHGLLMCLTWYNMKVIRKERNKWYVSPAEWPHPEYPPYCSGAAYVLSPDVAVAAVNASRYTPFFWVDDLYITGLVMAKAGIQHVNIRPRYELVLNKFEDAYSDAWAHVHEEADETKIRTLFKDKLPLFTHARRLSVSRLHKLWNVVVAVNSLSSAAGDGGGNVAASAA